MRLKPQLWLSAAIALGLFLRLFKLTPLFHFTMDEALLAFRGWGLFVLGRPFLIGGISPLQVHLPPYFYYLSALFLPLSRFNPIAWGVVAAAIGLATLLSLFSLAKKLFTQEFALIAVLLYATSFTAVFFDRHFWPLVFNPLLTTLALLLLTKLKFKKVGPFWPYFWLGLVLVFAVSADPSNLMLLAAILLTYFIFRRRFNRRAVKGSLLVSLGLFVAPLLAFDLRHGWENLRGVSRLFTNLSAKGFAVERIIDGLLLLPRSFARFWYSPQTSLAELYSYCFPFAQGRQRQLSWLLVVSAAALLVWFIVKKFTSRKPAVKAIVVLLLTYFVGVVLFGVLGFSLFDHYLAGLLPVFALITAWVLTKLPRSLTYTLTAIIVALNLFQVSRAHHPYGLSYKNQLVSWAQSELSGQPFALDSVSKCHRENGLRYLFELTDNPPVISFMDSNFFWLYARPPVPEMPERILLLTDKPLTSDLPVIARQQFGAMTAYLLDNSTKTYKLSF
ncbi:MAG: Glycosyl transferase family 39 [Candidatus Beckwithbacteria bacterium GW2011_GWB1_47_15]|uniref:Glycosyl transferase family 39 n=1 Tax=Candidatus Beckwithbacteria bacterium GW2011_GWB1_47_15 TaxID=1618371 RepID=A0A0G1RX44_9BACT|nr:MAG: hypothetical protein UY43_C0001G0675 [Candidatus Beckwithbacteria bacterium GW2011_GWC1_49_16]KKU35653.1 MAG: Glycosyl transferase family 39 [Candidatus Beckwithbacteria bacterium GW2011_GWA1_46_30]KKU61707.1 MAG: Glycosyl transferase family 39 [Candidatus Beckwithbacteria bacterium GW2011_GWB1_47_15]KKU72210.1 MAG: Glycosyl transferase family 39 [Candidatus Beckwithbacteria bacterium GW2011_GWA2_47_25]KKW05028.1 MAG: Glycosyl transferase family 39 [Candidatus Beckwithbacteria bacterium